MKLIFAIMIFISTTANALVLEELTNSNQLQEILHGKRVCFYPGAFDPFHKGHEELVSEVIEDGYCDYVIVYPSWGGDKYKSLTDVKLRIQMLFAIYADHPRTIVTKMSPEQLQKTLTRSENLSNFLKPIENIKFIGIVGSDSALKKWQLPSKDFSFMGNRKIPTKYYSSTYGGLMALPAESFIVALRNEDDIAVLNGKISGRKIIATIKNKKTKYISSTLIKKRIKNYQKIDNYVPSPVLEFITKQSLYFDQL